MKKRIIVCYLCLLLIGGLMYVLFRSSTLLMFNWYEQFGISSWILEVRSYTVPLNGMLPDWVVFSLPDGLWLAAYVGITLAIWNYKVDTKSLFWICILPIVALGSEIGQLVGVVPGVYDINDLLCYFLGISIPFICVPQSIKLHYT